MSSSENPGAKSPSLTEDPSRTERWRKGISLFQLIVAFIAILCVFLMGSCSLYTSPYRESTADPAVRTVIEKDSIQYDFRYVEADDRGWFWHPEQADNALTSIETISKDEDTLVVVFVHGWNHSSSCYDENVEAFKNVLARLDTELKTYTVTKLDTGRVKNLEAKGKSNVASRLRVFGIFVSWRGRSLPGFLNMATFWGRKTAAETFGTRDLREFMHRLQHLYKGNNSRPEPKPFFGLVSIGHSFGGAALLKATSFEFEKQLEDVNPQSAYSRKSSPGNPPTRTVS